MIDDRATRTARTLLGSNYSEIAAELIASYGDIREAEGMRKGAEHIATTFRQKIAEAKGVL